jgi:SAGA-associated factor 29
MRFYIQTHTHGLSYEVEDVDEEGRKGSKQFSWNTTLKSIIPLPVKDHPDTYPSAVLPPGTTVLGLYPDTTTFYKGKVKSGPSDRARRYKVLFEDDADNGALNVGMEHVVPIT